MASRFCPEPDQHSYASSNNVPHAARDKGEQEGQGREKGEDYGEGK